MWSGRLLLPTNALHDTSQDGQSSGRLWTAWPALCIFSGMKATLDSARRAFAAGPPPYVQAADLLSVIAARAYARGYVAAGRVRRPSLKFRSEVARDDFYDRANRAALEAAAAWQPRDRRAGFEAFKQHVFAAVDKECREPLQAQGRATGGRRPDIQNSESSPDTRGNPDGALDIAAHVTGPEHQPADAVTLAEFKRLHEPEWKLATAVAPYTDNTPARYAQQCRPRSKYTDAQRSAFHRQVEDAATMLRLFAQLRVPSSGLDFEGIHPPPVHHVLMGLASFTLPGRPPTGSELLGPFGKSGELVPIADVVRDKEGAPSVRLRKEDGKLTPYARTYLAKLLIWALPLSEAVVAEQLRTATTVAERESATERLKAIRAERARWEATDVGQAALAIDARREAARKPLKGKRSTRKA